MARARTVAKWSLGAAGIVALALGLLLFTPPGLALVGRLAGPLSGGAVTVRGLGGTSPNSLHADAIAIADAKGVWLRADKAVLDWSALAMLVNHVSIRSVTAARVTVLRRPIPSDKPGGETPRIDIAHLRVARIQLAAPVIGHAAALTANGALHYASRHQLGADLTVARLDNTDTYRIQGDIADDVAHGGVTLREGADGILGKLAGLPGLGPVNMTAAARGDSAANRLDFTLTAGLLRANGHGTIRLATQNADLDFSLRAPAMQPRPDMGWQALAMDGHFHGGFSTPNIMAHLVVTKGQAAGVTAGELALDIAGDGGRADLTGAATRLTLPGDTPNLFAHAPVKLQAHADLKAAARPVHFAIGHPLAALKGEAVTRGTVSLSALLTIPSLAPFAASRGIDMRGSASLQVRVKPSADQTELAVTGKMNAQGTAIVARLLGRNATLDMNATVRGSDIPASAIRLHGAGIASDVSGSMQGGVLDYRLALELPDLSRFANMLDGRVTLRGGAHGPIKDVALSAKGDGLLATTGFARQRVAISLTAQGLPSPKTARLALDGHLDGAPLSVHAALQGKTRAVTMTARWKSLDAKADIALPEKAPLHGEAHLAVQQLADLAVFTGQAIAGAAEANITFTPHGAATDAVLAASLRDVRDGANGAGLVALQGRVADLFGKPVLAVTASAKDVTALDMRGSAQARADGPLEKLALHVAADLKDRDGQPGRLAADAVLALPTHKATLTTLSGDWRGAALTLDAPATFDFSEGLGVDRIAAHLAGGKVTASGRILPRLALTASADGIALEKFHAFLPRLSPRGTVSAHATLNGTLAAPLGNIAIKARDLRAAFTSRATPSAAFDAEAQLKGDHAGLTVHFTAGPSANFTLQGDMPLAADKAMALHVNGTADLVLLDPLLAIDGRRARGAIAFDAAIGGTIAAPQVKGGGKLQNGEFQDYARGLRIREIAMAVEAQGALIRVTSFAGRAGTGTVSGSGTLDLAAKGMPLDFNLVADKARPIASTLVTATVSGNLSLKGQLKGLLNLGGKMDVTGGTINLPDNFPPDVAVLNVRRRGSPPPPPPASPSRVALDVAIRTTGPIFLRGHGMDAEMSGGIRLGGSSTAPTVGGGFRMVRGSYSVAGQTLQFTSGRIGFDGTGVRGRLDPTLDFQAQTVSGGVTATLQVSGYASAPRITLSSTPQLPQDEVVAHLLFQQSVKQLSPLQLASIAQALAAMGGVGGGFNPLGTVRQTLGLDRLAVGSTGSGETGPGQTTVEAGRYVMQNVYVGVKQNLSGGTQTQVQVDITRRLKAQATVSTGVGATAPPSTATQDNGSSIGLSYQFEY